MPQGTRFEQVDRYLAELREALSDRPADERADIVAAIREHIESALGEDASAADVEQVLRALGDPLAIAAEAGLTAVPRDRVEHVDLPRWQGLAEVWVPPLAILLIMSGAFGFLIPLVPAVVLMAGLVPIWASSRWAPREKRLATWVSALPIALWLFLVPFWLVIPAVAVLGGLALLLGSPLWTSRQRLVGAPLLVGLAVTFHVGSRVDSHNRLLIAVVAAWVVVAVVLGWMGMRRGRRMHA